MAQVEFQFPEKLQFLFQPMRYKVARGGRGCLAPGTAVIMFDGSLRHIENIKVGDQLLGPDSKPRKVVGLFHGFEPMYKVIQTSADDYIVNGAHVLVLKKNTACANDRGELMPSGRWRRNSRYAKWPEEVEISVEEWLKQSLRWKDNFRGFRAGQLDFPRKPVDIDPYLLGLWLGDGLHRELLITTADNEIVEWLQTFAMSAGLSFTMSSKGQKNRASDIRLGRIPSLHGRKNPVWHHFKRYGLTGKKHIPEDYIVNSEVIRLELLAGLIDSDGHYSRGGYTITLANQRLAMDIKRLTDTLGFRTSISCIHTKYAEYKGEAWRLCINGDTPRIPCKLNRKKATVTPNKNKMLSMINIVPVGDGEYYGVELDGDKRFLLSDGTVTHNSAKSWSFARALLIQGAQQQLRILCTREVQKSIKDSVLRLLADQIKAMGLESFYQVLDTQIRGKNGTLFIFSGLSSQTTDQLKSYEGVDRVWCEEAQSISKRSWDVLIPTIRKPGSEIWISYNPELETDETHQRFVVNPPDDCVSVMMNYHDNPWFPAVLEKERLRCKVIDPLNYDNIWEGACKPAVSGAIYYGEIARAQETGQICNLPYDPKLRVHAIFDMGWNDAMTISLVQRVRSELRIIEYIEDSHKTLDHYSAELRKKNLNWGKVFLPHDGNTKDYKTGKSAADIMRGFGWDVEIVDNMSIEQGIKLARMAFGQMYFDKDKTARLVECIKRYRRIQNVSTGEFGQPLHDEYSHGADNLRYIAVAADRMDNMPKYRQTSGSGESMAAFV